MRTWLVFLWICLSCSAKEEAQQQAVTYEVPDNEKWVTYEGVVRAAAGNDIKMELSLLQRAAGVESEYRTKEEHIISQDERLLATREGKYSILYGSGSDMTISLTEASPQLLTWHQGEYGINPKSPSGEAVASTKTGKLVFKTGRNSNELVLLDGNSNPVSDDDRYTLKKRSLLFTVEGFITMDPNATDLFEINTRENWNVAKAGNYGEVLRKYQELATEKHEGIYLKGIAFYVEDTDTTGAEVKNLVIKKIIDMKSHQQYSRLLVAE